MERGQWDAWSAIAATLAALVLVAYVVELYRQRHRGLSSSLTTGGIYTAVGLALVVVGLLPPLPGIVSRSATLVGCLLTVFGPWLHQRRRRVHASRAA